MLSLDVGVCASAGAAEVASGAGVSILPETAVAADHVGVRQLRIARMPPRRLALVTARGVQLSLADQAVHDAVRRIVRDERLPSTPRPE